MYLLYCLLVSCFVVDLFAKCVVFSFEIKSMWCGRSFSTKFNSVALLSDQVLALEKCIILIVVGVPLRVLHKTHTVPDSMSSSTSEWSVKSACMHQSSYTLLPLTPHPFSSFTHTNISQTNLTDEQFGYNNNYTTQMTRDNYTYFKIIEGVYIAQLLEVKMWPYSQNCEAFIKYKQGKIIKICPLLHSRGKDQSKMQQPPSFAFGSGLFFSFPFIMFMTKSW